ALVEGNVRPDDRERVAAGGDLGPPAGLDRFVVDVLPAQLGRELREAAVERDLAVAGREAHLRRPALGDLEDGAGERALALDVELDALLVALGERVADDVLAADLPLPLAGHHHDRDLGGAHDTLAGLSLALAQPEAAHRLHVRAWVAVGVDEVDGDAIAGRPVAVDQGAQLRVLGPGL